MTDTPPHPSAATDTRLLERARAIVAPFRELYPYEPHFHAVPGGSLHYVDEGPRTDAAVLCVHGNPTWSFYWRALVDALAPAHRVIAPDHLGMGLSTRPGRAVTLSEHVDNLVSLVDALGLREVTLACHDWGGAIGFGAALARRQVFARFLVTNTAAFPSSRIPKRIALCRAPLLGGLLVRGANGFAGAATRMTTVRRLPAEVKRAYLAPYGNWGDRAQVHHFVKDIPMKVEHPSWAKLCEIGEGLDGLRGLPLSIVWGDRDWCFDTRYRAMWEHRFPKAPVDARDDAGHYLMEDAPNAVVDAARALLRQSVRGLPSSSATEARP